ncbi:MAG: translation initiation factor IF-2 [Simkaniaceae bacterium]|nr:translation initiation factor IF-2 [Simkaniaceae bacterium]
MAKNLKIKVKNAQFAEALKLNKLKKSDATPAKKKPPVKKAEVAQPAEKPAAPPKPKAKAKDLVPIKKAPQPAKAEAKAAPKEKATSEKKTAALTPKKKEMGIGYIRPGTDKSALQKKAKEAAEKKAKQAQAAKKPATSKPAKTDESKPQSPSTSAGDKFKKTTYAKDNRPSRRSILTENKRFDSRDRQGLRSSDDEPWRRRRGFKQKQKKAPEPVIRPTELSIKLPIAIKDLAASMKYKAAELISKLFMQGLVVTINDYLDDETTVQLLGEEFGCTITIDTSEEERLQITGESIKEEVEKEEPNKLKSRAPVVAFMGHVDHGKTSLIDAIRESNITSGEAGAITQHIGAFRCHLDTGSVTVLDTPGHEAFSAMRSRGATVTDVVVLVVAGDEGIKPQTDEAIQQARAAGVPMVVAINKCDKPGFNADNVYRELADRELLPEAWGGETITVNVSATTKEGLPTLLEMLLLQSEVLELKANPDRRARGTILESELKKGLGITATLLVQNGTLKHGDALVIDDVYGRVKTMHNEHGKDVKKASPSIPVEITGLSDIPEAGLEFIVVDSEKEARKLAEDRLTVKKHTSLMKGPKGGLEGLMQRKAELTEKKVLKVILKADVQGSLEAVTESLMKIKSTKAEVNIISSDVGEISESDVEMAAASGAVILGFHTSIESHAEPMIKKMKIQLKQHDVIYHLIDDVKELMIELLDKIRVETEVGSAEIKQVFKSSQLGLIAGCQVQDGIIKRSHYAKQLRDGKVIWEGNIASLKRVQEDVKEVSKGLECGILLQGVKDYQVEDVIQAFEITYKTDTL